MTYIKSNGILRYEFESFRDAPILHGIFTRNGGVSPAPWASLNLGGTVGDSRENVIENRRRIFESIQRNVNTLYDVWQVHGTEVIRATQPRNGNPHIPGDAMITNNPHLTLLMRFADCVPIFLYDSQNNAIGIVHAGWQGTIRKVVQHTITAMMSDYGTIPGNLLAGIGPSIGPDHYFVGNDVIDQAKAAFGRDWLNFFQPLNQSITFDLWSTNYYLLEEIGVHHIEVAGICTACNTDHWYSHRAEKGKTGRFGAIFALEQ